jgi:hypothetical protein
MGFIKLDCNKNSVTYTCHVNNLKSIHIVFHIDIDINMYFIPYILFG